MIRDLLARDVEILRSIHNDDRFPFPELTNSLYFDKNIVENDSGIIAAGISKLTSEGILIIDESRPITERTKAIISLIEYMKMTTHKKGMTECHIWAQNENIELLLFKLGFRPCKGKAMVMYYG